MKDNFHVTLSSKKSAAEIVQSLEQNLKEEGFSILFTFDIHKKLEEKSLPYPKNITVLEVCNPKEASDILGLDPMASFFLPCKVILSEEKTGETKVGLLSPKVLLGFLESEEMNQVAEKIEERLMGTIKRAI